MLGPGDFFGEGCLAGQRLRMGSATALTPSTVMLVDKDKMVGLLHEEHAMSDRFISHMLARKHPDRRGSDRSALQLERETFGAHAVAAGPLREAGQAHARGPADFAGTLAEMVGTTRSRVNFFLNKFKKLGFIEYDGDNPLKINSSLLSVVLHD
jgi:CRP-like cAMP-binding protein